MNLTLLLILALATWRLSSLLARERGFYGWALRLRDSLENTWPQRLRENGCFPKLARLCREAAAMVGCTWCASRPIGALAAALAYAFTDCGLCMACVLALALSGATCLIDEVIGWLERAHPQS
jgi:hypothetical protein